MESLIEQFVTVCYSDGIGIGDGRGSGYGYGTDGGNGNGHGSGYGYGYGDGNGKGNGKGYGYGYGYSNGYGDGSSTGSGFGNGYGISSINGENVCMIDGVPTIIHSVHGNYARGAILRQDMTLQPCYIARQDNSFAHGETLAAALRDATNKVLRNEPVERRIERFRTAYPDFEKPIPAKELFDWHNILTGSCLFGRQQFCKEHGIDVYNDRFTVREFVGLTENAYGGDIIQQLKKI